MPEKVYRNFFILCAILSQGIVGSFLKGDIGESSNVLVREKRVINRVPGQDIPLQTGDVPYVVNIKIYNRLHCTGSILAYRTVITASNCVIDPNLMAYSIISGSAYTYRGDNHTFIEKKIHGHRESNREVIMTGIALIIVNPPFQWSRTTSKINLHVGPILPGMEGLVTGWGTHVHKGNIETNYPRRVRSITVPILDHRVCVNAYRNIFEIREDNICTYDQQKQCGVTDAGAPLVINSQLAGIHLAVINPESVPNCNDKPNIFVLLQNLENSQWIRRNIVD